jgi:SSS family solute:Na+ symporter/sodium/pantothenate symporter
MVAGTCTTLGLYLVGTIGLKAFGLEGILADTTMIGPAKGLRPYYLGGLDPCVWGLLASLTAGIIGSLVTRPPDPARVALLFDLQPPDAPAPATLELHPELSAGIAQ